MRWVIHYDDGSTFSSDDGPPEAAPLDGVLAIEEEYDDGGAVKRQVYRGPEYYLWTGDSWAAGSLADLERWLRREMPRLKYGRWTTRELWQKTLARVRSR